MNDNNKLTTVEIDKVTAEILIYKQQTAQNIIEIGKRLIKVKENLPHGEFLPYLETKVEFTRQSANKFMRVAKEFGNVNSGLHLGTKKLWLLLDVSTEEREDFISQPHKVSGKTKTVDEMTSREMQKVIKEKKQLEEKAKTLEESNEVLQQSYNELSQELQEEKEKPGKIVRVEVDNTDYTIAKKNKELLYNILKKVENYCN
ncbi:DUF3102 domain-containing protein [Clostridium arbusti]|uniref:DUF3102 domain-containing protein n=1 Tax=Clostridium arbusti TaxID=1137848 RepID=UPI0002888CEC|nr:DUF3102 domain-containing protein [Clostridium arbusti]